MRDSVDRAARSAGVAVIGLALASCSMAYYRALETFGVEKRDILTNRVEEARESQVAAKEQFTDALEQYRALIDIDGGDLEDTYDDLNRAFERSESRAETVSNRIDSIENVAEDLFDEWEDEIGQYSDRSLRRQSERLLQETQRDYGRMLAAMRRAESTMAPVLTLFQDQVLFLRHNLNARAIGALETELADIEVATRSAIAEMEESIAQAERFIASMS